MKTIATHHTDEFEAVAFIDAGGTDEETGEEITNVLIRFNLRGNHAGGVGQITLGFKHGDRGERSLAMIASMDGDRFEQIFRKLVAPYYVLDSETREAEAP